MESSEKQPADWVYDTRAFDLDRLLFGGPQFLCAFLAATASFSLRSPMILATIACNSLVRAGETPIIRATSSVVG
jgi:hypothetical protein